MSRRRESEIGNAYLPNCRNPGANQGGRKGKKGRQHQTKAQTAAVTFSTGTTTQDDFEGVGILDKLRGRVAANKEKGYEESQPASR